MIQTSSEILHFKTHWWPSSEFKEAATDCGYVCITSSVNLFSIY